jgi:hypothetical protein
MAKKKTRDEIEALREEVQAWNDRWNSRETWLASIIMQYREMTVTRNGVIKNLLSELAGEGVRDPEDVIAEAEALLNEPIPGRGKP